MINLSSPADVLSLPCVPINRLYALPESRGVYFIADDEGSLFYIGIAVNLRKRWAAHHRHSQAEKNGARIFYLQVPGNADLEKLETEFINQLAPSWNKQPMNNAPEHDERMFSRAAAAFFRTAEQCHESPQLSRDLSGVETIDGKTYVVLRSANSILAIYRMRPYGPLKRLKRWPKELENW